MRIRKQPDKNGDLKTGKHSLLKSWEVFAGGPKVSLAPKDTGIEVFVFLQSIKI
jgi:hypothetical protein